MSMCSVLCIPILLKVIDILIVSHAASAGALRKLPRPEADVPDERAERLGPEAPWP